jgi:hypothetical protein
MQLKPGNCEISPLTDLLRKFINVVGGQSIAFVVEDED